MRQHRDTDKLYSVHFTVEVTVHGIVADNDAQAKTLASRELTNVLADDGYNVLTSRIEACDPEGPAKIKAYDDAVAHANAMEKAHGYDSNEAVDARRALSEAIDNLPDGA